MIPTTTFQIPQRKGCSSRTKALAKCLTISNLEELCDDPARNESGQEVQAVLSPGRLGIALNARDGADIYMLVDEQGKQLSFSSIELALDLLSDVSHLLGEVVIDIRPWRPTSTQYLNR